MVWVKQKTKKIVSFHCFVRMNIPIISIHFWLLNVVFLWQIIKVVFIEYSLTNLIFSIIQAMHIIQSSIGIVMRKLMVLLVE